MSPEERKLRQEWWEIVYGINSNVRSVHNFKHLEEKQVTQYQALLPVDLEHHLYAGSTLYDLEKHEFRKISTVSKVSRKTGHTTTITFVGGAKRILTSAEALDEFAKGHNWVTLRETPVVENTKFYARWNPLNYTFPKARDTRLNDAAVEYINDSISGAIERALKEHPKMPVGESKKRRWFR